MAKGDLKTDKPKGKAVTIATDKGFCTKALSFPPVFFVAGQRKVARGFGGKAPIDYIELLDTSPQFSLYYEQKLTNTQI